MPAPHPPEFRHRAVELARQGDKSLLQLAKDLGQRGRKAHLLPPGPEFGTGRLGGVSRSFSVFPARARFCCAGRRP